MLECRPPSAWSAAHRQPSTAAPHLPGAMFKEFKWFIGLFITHIVSAKAKNGDKGRQRAPFQICNNVVVAGKCGAGAEGRAAKESMLVGNLFQEEAQTERAGSSKSTSIKGVR